MNTNTPEQVRARQMDDLVPNLTPRLWKNPTKDTVTLVVGHGEGFRGRALGKIVVPPGEEAYIERKYDKAVPRLAPQLEPVEPFGEGEGPVARPRTADDLVPVMTHTARPVRKIVAEPAAPVAKQAEQAAPAAKTQTVKREESD